MNAPINSFNFKARVIIAHVVLGLCFGAVLLRAVFIMVVNGPGYREMARKQHLRVEKLVPRRGAIVDRNGRVLAESVLVDSLYAHPGQVPDPEAASRILAPILRESEQNLLQLLASDKNFVWLKRALSPAQATAIKRNDIPGMALVSEYARYYPEGRLAAHIIGFTGTDGLGLEGIEHRFNAQLTGDEMSIEVERDARGRSIYTDSDTLPISRGGNRITLTIDVRVQQIVEEALDDAANNAQANIAFAAVMEIQTGKILAMASRPTFNPNDFKRYPQQNYRNRMISDMFEPGSTFKVFTLAAMLDTGVGKADDELFCEDGAFEVDGSIINDTSPHGWFTVEEIIVHSSNIGAAKMGLKLGRERLGDYVTRFGFGKPTGIDLMGENAGIARPMNKISRVGVATIAFGQGISVTGIQLLSAFNGIANDGQWLQPKVVDRIEDFEGNPVHVADGSTRRIISPETTREELRVLTNVIHGGGTGGRAAPSGYTAAGKTGTAQKVNLQNGGYYEDKYVASFLGLAPLEKPVISILVVVDDPKGEPWGATVAAPAFRQIAERVLPILGVLPEGSSRPLNEIIPNPVAVNQVAVNQVTEPAAAENCAACMPNLVGLTQREILVAASARGAKVEIVGSGRVITQNPQPGTPIAGENRWWVRLVSDPY